MNDMQFSVDAVLLDIEGTVAPIAFVYDVLFPYARDHLASFLEKHWADEPVISARTQIIADSRTSARPIEDSLAGIQAEVLRLMDADAKQTGLKQLQGLIWEEGYRLRQLQSELFPDVAPALRQWHASGKTLAIYSSGSIAAQRVFFRHTNSGDLTAMLSQFFDTTTGPKRSPESYQKIATQLRLDAARILFLSDVPEELRAASRAGFSVALAVRPGNAVVAPAISLPRIASFDELKIF
jgi:enolase-phosphatase E1